MNQTHLTEDQRRENQHNLAIDRTVFAFERTALAYMRTSLTFIIAGISLIKFFENLYINTIGLLLIPIALCFMYLGVQKFREMHIFLKRR